MSGACSDCGHDDCQCEAVTYVAPMSRREEVKAGLDKTEIDYYPYKDLAEVARALADEVDAERAVVTKLLEMLEPGVAPPKSHTSCECFDCRTHEINEGRYARACKIAGRVK